MPALNLPLTKTQTQLREIAMALFNVDLRRESVKAAQAFGTLLGERVNKAAWKSYVPAIVDLIIAADRGDETAADKVDALLVDGITMDDLIAIGAACKVVGVHNVPNIASMLYKIGVAADQDPETKELLQRALGGYQAAVAAARAADNECGIGAPSDEESAESRAFCAERAKEARNILAALVDATSKLSKVKQLSIARVYAEMAVNVIDYTGIELSPDVDAVDAVFNGAGDYREKFQAAVIAEMESAHVPAHVIEAYKAQSAQRNAEEDAAIDGWENA